MIYNVFPNTITLSQFKQGYENYSAINTNTKAIDCSEYLNSTPNNDDTYILWTICPSIVNYHKLPKLYVRYMELLSENSLPQSHQVMLDNFKNSCWQAKIAVNSQAAISVAAKNFSDVIYLPIGYDPGIFGEPDFNCEKDFDIVYYGSCDADSLRIDIVNAIRKHFKFCDISGAYGKDRTEHLNRT